MKAVFEKHKANAESLLSFSFTSFRRAPPFSLRVVQNQWPAAVAHMGLADSMPSIIVPTKSRAWLEGKYLPMTWRQIERRETALNPRIQA